MYVRGDNEMAHEKINWQELRTNWKKLIIGDGRYDLEDEDIQKYIKDITHKAEGLYSTMNKCTQNKETYLWADIAMEDKGTHKGSSQVTLSYDRLKVIAMAYGLNSIASDRKEEVKNEMIAALEMMNKYHYNTCFEAFGNWFDWHIGSPLRYLDILFMMYDELTAEQIERLLSPIHRFTPEVDMTGANRVWKSHIVALSGILEENTAKMEDVKEGLREIFAFVTTGDGFYEDGSFIQHEYFPYTGGYGKAFIVTMAPLMNLLSKSPWALKYEDGCEKNFCKMLFEAYEPVIYKGIMMDMIRSREISRIGGQDHIAGRQVIRAMIYMLDVLEGDEKVRGKCMIKYWLDHDAKKQIYTDPADGYFLEYYVSLPIIVMAKELVADKVVTNRGPLTVHKRYAAMDRVVHSRENFRVGIAMHSDRTRTYEIINTEGTHMWHTADGMMYVYTKDIKRYSDDFWGTVDHGRLPGTTVVRMPKAENYRANTHNSYDWVGGSDSGNYGISGMELDNDVHSKKSWIMFDEEIVVLTSDITSKRDEEVESTIENCKLKDDLSNQVMINGQLVCLSSPQKVVADTLYIEGNVPESGIGYYFPESVELELFAEAREQSWQLMNNYEKFKDESIRKKNFVTAVISHGTNPKKQAYSYVVLPGKEAKEVEAYAENPKVQVLRNDEGVQAVRHVERGILAINFWNQEAAKKGCAGICASQPISIIGIEKAGILEVALSEPTWKYSGQIELSISKEVAKVISADETIKVNVQEKRIQVSIEVTSARGKSHRLKVRLK